LIVVAVTGAEMHLLVDRSKRKSAERSVPDVAELSDSVVGRLINARSTEVLKAGDSRKKGEIVRILLPGWMDPEDTGNLLGPSESVILLLSRVDPSDHRFKDVEVHSLSSTPLKVLPFDPSNSYEFAGETGCVLSPTSAMLAMVRKEIHATKNRARKQ